MPPVCTVCRSPDRDEIDRALIAGTEGTRTIAGRYPDLSRSPIERHARVCLALSDPAGRLHTMAQRAELAAVAASAVERAQEAVDGAEARGDRRGLLAALTTLTRAVGAAERLLPDDGGFVDHEVKELLLVVAEEIDDPAARKVITAGLRARGAVDLAGVFDEVWRRRDTRPLAVTS